MCLSAASLAYIHVVFAASAKQIPPGSRSYSQ